MKDIQKLYELVKNKCKKYDETEHTDVWRFHIKPVIDNALILADKYGADKEVVEIAALLHDIANLEDIKKNSDNHHILGAEMAEELLKDCEISPEKVEKIKQCIINHRGSVNLAKNTIEEICVADADAVSHFYEVVELICWRAKSGDDVDEVSRFVKSKLIRSYNKMSEPSREFYKERYTQVMAIFNI